MPDQLTPILRGRIDRNVYLRARVFMPFALGFVPFDFVPSEFKLFPDHEFPTEVTIITSFSEITVAIDDWNCAMHSAEIFSMYHQIKVMRVWAEYTMPSMFIGRIPVYVEIFYTNAPTKGIVAYNEDFQDISGVIVSDADSPLAANGEYVASGEFEGNPQYTNGEYWIWWDDGDGKWYIAAQVEGDVLFKREDASVYGVYAAEGEEAHGTPLATDSGLTARQKIIHFTDDRALDWEVIKEHFFSDAIIRLRWDNTKTNPAISVAYAYDPARALVCGIYNQGDPDYTHPQWSGNDMPELIRVANGGSLTPMICVEGEHENRCLQSLSMLTIPWSAHSEGQGSITILPGYDDPMGGNSAFRIVASGNSNINIGELRQEITNFTGLNMASLFVKNNAGGTGLFTMPGFDETSDYEITGNLNRFRATDEWRLVWGKKTLSPGNTTWAIGANNLPDAVDILVYGGNWTNAPYPTLPIKTGDAPVLRIAPQPVIEGFLPDTGRISGWVDTVKADGYIFGGDVQIGIIGNNFFLRVYNAYMETPIPFDWTDRKKIGLVIEWTETEVKLSVSDNKELYTYQLGIGVTPTANKDILLGGTMPTSVFFHSLTVETWT